MKKMQNLASNNETIDFWPLFSKSCAGFRHTSDWQNSYNHFEHFSFEPNLLEIYNQDENIGFGTNTINTITVKATYYFVKSPSPALPNQQQINKWLPECGTNNPNNLIPFSFSLHIRENNELGINENQIPELTAYPNPADNSVNLRMNNGNIEKVFIYDLQGRVVFNYQESTNSKSVEVDLNDFQKGLYIIRVESHGGTVSSTKLIKR